MRFKSDFSLHCLSVSIDSAVVGAPAVQSHCENDRAQWNVIPVKGDLYRISSKINGLCLSVENDNSQGTKLVQLTCDDNIATRLWRFNLVTKISLVSDNTNMLSYELKNGASYFCTDIMAGSVTAGTQLSQTACTRETSQHWRALGTVPDTADRIELNLLVITKVASKIPGMSERTTSKDVRQKQRYWSETVMPRFFHDYTNGRVKLNVYYYESPYLLTNLADHYSVNPGDIPEDLDIVLNPGWFDGVFINHAAPVSWGLVTFGVNVNGYVTGFSNAPIDDVTPMFYTNDLAQIGGMVHEFMHQLEYYFQTFPTRQKATSSCAPNSSMLDCGSNELQGGSYEDGTDGIGHYLAFYRDFLNGYLWGGTAGLGEPVWQTNAKLRDRNKPFVPGGPLNPFANQSTCLDLSSYPGLHIKDLYPTNNFATLNNKNGSSNWTGDSFLFDGVDDYLRISNLVGDDFTISMWIKTSQIFMPSNDDGIGLVYAGSDDNGFELRGVRNGFDANTIKFIAGNYSAIIGTSEVASNSWVHIAVSRNRTTGIATLYVNGKKEAQGNAGTQRLNKNPLVKIGSAFQYPRIDQAFFNNDHFKGEMSDFCLLNSALNESEIGELANARKQTNSSGQHVYLSDMPVVSSSTVWGTLNLDKSVNGTPIKLGGHTYTKGLGIHAPSKVIFKLDQKASRFISDFGVDDESSGHAASASFLVYGDNVLLFDSGDKYDTDAAASVNIDVSGVNELKLVTTDGANANATEDHTDWADAQIILK